MSPRVYTRKFDYDEARRRYAAGESAAALAREYGVSAKRIQQVVIPELGERDARRIRDWQRNGTCPDCGDRASRNATTGQHRCRPCEVQARTTTVREGELRCTTCKEWLPDDEFPLNRALVARRGRHRQCRPCQTAAKRAWRARCRRGEAA